MTVQPFLNTTWKETNSNQSGSYSLFQVLVQTPTFNYTVRHYTDFFNKINFADGLSMRRDTEPLVYNLTPPGVPTHCLYGTRIPTSEAFKYTNKFPDEEPTVVDGDGDGTVNLISAMQCGRWAGHQPQPVFMQELPHNEHVGMLQNLTTVTYIKKVLFSPWCRVECHAPLPATRWLKSMAICT